MANVSAYSSGAVRRKLEDWGPVGLGKRHEDRPVGTDMTCEDLYITCSMPLSEHLPQRRHYTAKVTE